VLSDFRPLYDCNLISAAVTITRGEDLMKYLKKLIARKYGASSTWAGRLLLVLFPHLDRWGMQPNQIDFYAQKIMFLYQNLFNSGRKLSHL
jgi:hypothetical protein